MILSRAGTVAAGILLACITAMSAARAETSVRIATEGAYPPFNYVENNEPAGFEIDLGRALCAAMGVTCTFVLQDWDGMISGLKEHRYDAIMSSMEITPERRKRISFSGRYYRVPSALIGHKSTPLVPPGSEPILTGKAVGAVQDSEFAGYLESVPGGDLRTFGKLEEASLDLMIGRLDYVLGDRLALRSFLESREGKRCCRFVAEVPVNRGEGIGVGLRRDDAALREKFDAAILAVQADGTYDRIRAKYFPFDIR